jgi:hypothetical protein
MRDASLGDCEITPLGENHNKRQKVVDMSLSLLTLFFDKCDKCLPYIHNKY